MRLLQSRLRDPPETETVSHIPSQQTETIPPCPCDVHDTSGAMPTVPTLAPECHVPHRFPVEGECVGVKSIWLAKKANALHPGSSKLAANVKAWALTGYGSNFLVDITSGIVPRLETRHTSPRGNLGAAEDLKREKGE
jgi:hypothetical protein